MKTIILSLGFLFLNNLSFEQESFKDCHIELIRRLTSDTSRNIDVNSIPLWRNCIKGKQMPFLSLKSIKGENIETKELIGKVVFINLWFTSCMPCVAELPALNKLVAEYKDKDVVFLGISTDTKQMLDRDFFPRYKFDFTIIPDGNKIVEEIGHTGFPTIYIIDKKGNVCDAWIGGSIDKDAETAAYLRAKPIIDRLLIAE
jgi:peroxiredoxin